MDSSTGVGSKEEGVFDNGDSKTENGGGAGGEEGLAPEAIRSKVMHVASMDALRKKVQVLFPSVVSAPPPGKIGSIFTRWTMIFEGHCRGNFMFHVQLGIVEMFK